MQCTSTDDPAFNFQVSRLARIKEEIKGQHDDLEERVHGSKTRTTSSIINLLEKI